MEGNKDAALKCLHVAQRALQDGNREKALKLVERSMRLYPTKQAEDFFSRLKRNENMGHQNSNGSARSYGTFSKAQDSNGGQGSEKSSDKTEDYTQEQIEAVQRVNRNKDYYAILGVTKDASESELKKAYRKLALQLHPDKNKAPGATDAFKAVGTAFAVLSDKDKRQKYDVYGPEVSSQPRARYRHSRHTDYDDIDPDEIFNMFFGGGFPSGNVRVFRRGNTYYYGNSRSHGSQQNVNQHQNLAAWVQYMPLLVLLLLTLFSNVLIQENPYSLYAHGDYQLRRMTKSMSIKYYVKKDFDDSYKGSDLRRLEKRIEEEYIDYLRSSCYNERVNKETMRRKGVYFSNQEYIDRADKMKTPSCDELEGLYHGKGKKNRNFT